MVPSTDKAEIIIAIYPKHVANIIHRVKDHEFRRYLLPPTVTRMWIYETSPISSIQYVADISQGKLPGEITNEESLENAEFNALKGNVEYAYEIKKLFRLASPLSLSELKHQGWLRGAPQKYSYVKEDMKILEKKLIWDSGDHEKGPPTLFLSGGRVSGRAETLSLDAGILESKEKVQEQALPPRPSQDINLRPIPLSTGVRKTKKTSSIPLTKRQSLLSGWLLSRPQ